ncbi:DUF5076 domain-containing protein [Parvularcula flava]|uniref:DUF5076 domain-containing protein n=1 Tax=Aquisalinus luteolus TaxID=1566827 RepID=A0A8J3EUZ8_9PROT|nr:DUF5076 domain-containing protein [Aquisalinus luteolus]NHK28555.1 DUF5076 domain-containing protein [Aquisalinus luteolus]GGH98826.1 hypothetical protein GCM10011355_23340 [Aquisalinus luteolus]
MTQTVSKSVEKRILPLPDAIPSPDAGLELVRIWRSETDHYVSLFIGDDWTLERYAPFVIDNVRLILAATGAGTLKDVMTQALEHCESLANNDGPADRGRGQARDKNPDYHGDVPPQVMLIPCADPAADDAYEILRGWADGERLQVSVRHDMLQKPEEIAALLAHMILHIGRGVSKVYHVDASQNSARLIDLIKRHLEDS